MEENTRKGRTRKARKEVMDCVQDVIGKNKYLVQYLNRQKREMSYYFLVYVCSEGKVGQDVDESIYDIPQKLQGGLLSIDVDAIAN